MIDLGRQLSSRIECYISELPRHFTRPLKEVSFEGFTTFDYLPLQSARQKTRTPFLPNTRWGEKWMYGWFFASLTMPKQAQGKRIVLYSGLGGEQTVWLNGQILGAIDKQHSYVTIAQKAREGETVQIDIESYAGHGERLENIGLCPTERPVYAPCPNAQCVIAPSMLLIWEEDAYQLWLDAMTLWLLLKRLPARSLRAQRVAAALEEMTYVMDAELPYDERIQSFRKARAVLAPALSCHNGDSAPTMYIIGQSHVDLMWQWTADETLRKSARTYGNQLSLMREYPEYKFLLCEPALLDMLKIRSPALFNEVKAAVKSGQMLPEGAFYIECDCNLPGGESLIRQLARGKKWFKEELGVDSVVAWQPDTFGFPASLPGILKGCGVDYFATQKLLRQDPECEKLPFQNYYWEGIDGSRVLSHLFFRENAPITADELIRRWEDDRVQERDISGMLFPFGYGDGGGGATRDFVESARRLENLEGAPKTRYTGLLEFFKTLKAQNVKNTYTGEMYLSWHRGTYTAQRTIKALCRHMEEALLELEQALALKESAPVPACLKTSWDTLMMSEFHDVLGGVSIERVNQTIKGALKDALDDVTNAILDIHGAGNVLYNPLPYARHAYLKDAQGAPCRALFAPMGGIIRQETLSGVTGEAHAQGITLKNSEVQIELDNAGRITKYFLLGQNIDLVAPQGVMNDFRLYGDVNPQYDAWELARTYQNCRVTDAFDASVKITDASDGACEVTVCLTRPECTILETLTLYADDLSLHIQLHINWHERHKLLKLHFESALNTNEILSEIQFGFISRPAHQSTRYAADRYEVCQHRYSVLREENVGFAVLNNAVYGVSGGHGEMALSLLRAPLVPDPHCDQGEHDVALQIYPFTVPLYQAGVHKAAQALNRPVRPLSALPRQGIALDAQTVLMSALKRADSAEGIILRLYEACGARDTARVTLPFEAQVYACDMLESAPSAAPLHVGRELTLPFAPFEIKTLRLIKQG